MPVAVQGYASLVCCAASTLLVSASVAQEPPSCSAASSSQAPVAVVSYNLLSDSLCTSSYYRLSPPGACDAAARLMRVKHKLSEEIHAQARQRESVTTRPILCLQEVSRAWAAALVPFFEENNYAYATALYGNEFNGYMGQCVAWPRERFEVEEVETPRISDTVSGWKRSKPKREHGGQEVPGWQRLLRVLGLGRGSKVGSGVGRDDASLDPWAEAKRRHNCAVLARLKDKQSGKRFVIGDYHMPCLFGSDKKCQVMVAHASLLLQHVDHWAAGDPYIVAGDFNLTPHDPLYSFITRGGPVPQDHPHHPPPAPWDSSWSPTFPSVRSAYATYLGSEPELTNFAKRNEESEEFAETLDFIWISPEWHVRGVKPLPTRKDIDPATKSFPNIDEPSDHLMIRSDLLL